MIDSRVRIIQRYYRKYRARKVHQRSNIITCIKALELPTGKHTKAKHFDAFTEMIQAKPVVQFVQYILKCMHKYSNLSHKQLITPRQFLSVWVICLFPSQVLNLYTHTELFDIYELHELYEIYELYKIEQGMFEIAQKIKTQFESYAQPEATVTTYSIFDFLNQCQSFSEIFNKWKAFDSKYVINILRKSHRELESTKELIINNRQKQDLNVDEYEFVALAEKQQRVLTQYMNLLLLS